MIKTLNLEQAADFLKLHPEELRSRAKAGIVPAAKIGKRWVFIENDLADYVRSLYAAPRQALRVTSGKGAEICHSRNAVTRGTSTLLHHPASELDALLGLPIKPKRRNCTIS
jgi:hypothetical protein